MHIEVNFLGGEPIRSACIEACALATRIGCDVHFKFNDVTCMAFMHSDPADLEASWEEVSKSKRPYKVATSRERSRVSASPEQT